MEKNGMENYRTSKIGETYLIELGKSTSQRFKLIALCLLKKNPGFFSAEDCQDLMTKYIPANLKDSGLWENEKELIILSLLVGKGLEKDEIIECGAFSDLFLSCPIAKNIIQIKYRQSGFIEKTNQTKLHFITSEDPEGITVEIFSEYLKDLKKKVVQQPNEMFTPLILETSLQESITNAEIRLWFKELLVGKSQIPDGIWSEYCTSETLWRKLVAETLPNPAMDTTKIMLIVTKSQKTAALKKFPILDYCSDWVAATGNQEIKIRWNDATYCHIVKEFYKKMQIEIPSHIREELKEMGLRLGFRKIWKNPNNYPIMGRYLDREVDMPLFASHFANELLIAGFSKQAIVEKFEFLETPVDNLLKRKSPQKRMTNELYAEIFQEPVQDETIRVDATKIINFERHPSQSKPIFEITWMPRYCDGGDPIDALFYEAISQNGKFEVMFFVPDRGIFHYIMQKEERTENNRKIEIMHHISRPILIWKTFEVKKKIFIDNEWKFNVKVNFQDWGYLSQEKILLRLKACRMGTNTATAYDALLGYYLNQKGIEDLSSRYSKAYGFFKDKIVMPPDLVIPEDGIQAKIFERFRSTIAMASTLDETQIRKDFKILWEATKFPHRDIIMAWSIVSPHFYSLKDLTSLIPILAVYSNEGGLGKSAIMNAFIILFWGVHFQVTGTNFDSASRTGAYMCSSSFPNYIDDIHELREKLMDQIKPYTSGVETWDEKKGGNTGALGFEGGQALTVNREWVSSMSCSFNAFPSILIKDKAFAQRNLTLEVVPFPKDPEWEEKRNKLPLGYGFFLVRKWMEKVKFTPEYLQKRYSAIKKKQNSVGRANAMICLLTLGQELAKEILDVDIILDPAIIGNYYEEGLKKTQQPLRSVIIDAINQVKLREVIVGEGISAEGIFLVYFPTPTFPNPIFVTDQYYCIDQNVARDLQKVLQGTSKELWNLAELCNELKILWSGVIAKNVRVKSLPAEFFQKGKCAESKAVSIVKKCVCIPREEIDKNKDQELDKDKAKMPEKPEEKFSSEKIGVDPIIEKNAEKWLKNIFKLNHNQPMHVSLIRDLAKMQSIEIAQTIELLKNEGKIYSCSGIVGEESLIKFTMMPN